MVTFPGPELKHLVKWASPDVKFLKESPLSVEGTWITGWIHHLETGEVVKNSFVFATDLIFFRCSILE
jgi:hypothetical protein